MKFNVLLNHLNYLIKKDKYENDVEILFIEDQKQMTIGDKRQRLLEMAKGQMICYIDDDDWVPSYYLKKILEVIKPDVDCIGFKIDCNINGKQESAIASNIYDCWCEDRDGYKHCRTPYHKTPVKRSIALQIGFNRDMRFGEDALYSKQLKQSGLIKKEEFIPFVLYKYTYIYERNKYGDGK